MGKIDSGMAKLQKKRESQRLIFSSLAKESAAKTSVILSAIDDEKILQADEEQKSPSIHVQNDTEIINENAMMDMKMKRVVVVSDDDIKSEEEVADADKLRTLQSTDSGFLKDLEDLLDENDDEKMMEHQANDTIVLQEKETAQSPQSNASHFSYATVNSSIDDAMMDDALEQFDAEEESENEKRLSPQKLVVGKHLIDTTIDIDDGLMVDVLSDMEDIDTD